MSAAWGDNAVEGTVSAIKPVDPKTPVLLPTNVTPTKYTLALNVDLAKYSFEGVEDVMVTVSEATTSIVLHSREIYIKKVSYSAAGGAAVEPEQINFNFAKQDALPAHTASFVFKEALAVGEGTLHIEFTGCLNDQMAGFYRSSYTSVSGEKRIMASTQFEALDARRAFPCWDEPAVKATFDVTLEIPADRICFSNMPEVAATTLAGGTQRVRFAETPKMSTYLLAFCVGEFDFVQGYSSHGVQVRTYTPPGKTEMGRFALKVALDTLDLYDDFFQVPYPLPKLDMVAIPEFACGAMENWGLVTYREVDLLIDDDKASNSQRQRVASVVAHELAHQWFGNLVTMQWWDDIWLNEGFASWMQTYACDALFPEWGMWEQFITDDQSGALRLDSLRTSHPIQVPIAHAEEVEEVFDMISYCKGACVIRLIHAVIGADAFRKGLQIYFKRHQYGNTVTLDLWAAWSEASGKPMAELLAGWTGQMGYPVLKLEAAKFEAGQAVCRVTQQWFLSDGSSSSSVGAAGEASSGPMWLVPVLAACASNVDAPALKVLQGGAGELTFACAPAEGAPEDAAWLKLNAGQHIPIRVMYSDETFERLLKAVQSNSLPPADRAGLVADYAALARAGATPVSTLFNAMRAGASDELNYTVWQSLEQAIAGLNKVLAAELPELHAQFQDAVSVWVSAAFSKVGWEPREGDGHLGGMLRGLLIRLLGDFSKDAAVLTEARRRFSALMADPTDAKILPADYKTPVFKMVLKNSPTGGEEEYTQLLALYEKLDTNVERKQIFLALGAASSPELKRRTLAWCISGEIKMQDFFYPMSAVAGSGKQGVELCWEFFQENFAAITCMLANASPSLMNAVIVYCCGGACSEERADAIAAFFEAHPQPTSARKIAQMLESMRTNAKFLAHITADEGFAAVLAQGGTDGGRDGEVTREEYMQGDSR